MSTSSNKRACVVVLGDIGRSPRMQYHIESLLKENYSVDIIGCLESKPNENIISSSKAAIHQLRNFPEMNLPNTLKYIFKTIWQALSLLLTLLRINRPDFIIVQNPPAIPTLPIVYLYCKLFKTHFVIDWHNYTYSILAINSSEKSFFVKLTRFTEKYFGRKSNLNFCVTKAMQEDLKNNWDISAIVLYDRAAEQFHPIELEEKHQFFLKLSNNIFSQFSTNYGNSELERNVEYFESTPFTYKSVDNMIKAKESRPAILISSTSWTPDEDFGILLSSLQDYDNNAEHSTEYPELLCIITGKGPQKNFYEEKIKTIPWKKVKILTPWLEENDYPTLIASADLGVCLHWSSSGLDLPMKVVDMFGCGLPVCAVNFQCLKELVKDNENGFIFEDQTELSRLLQNWFHCFPNSKITNELKEKFQENLKEFQKLRWEENWKNVVFPALCSLYNLS